MSGNESDPGANVEHPSVPEFPDGCYFSRVCNGADVKHPGEIYFVPVPDRTIPAEMLDLVREVESATTILEEIFQRESNEYKRHFGALLRIAQLGLLGERANPWAASIALENFKAKIVQSEGRKLKRAYLARLLKALSLAFLLLGIVGFAIFFLFEATNAKYPIPSSGTRIFYSFYAWMLCGAMLGIGLSFSSRKQPLTFEELFNREDVLIDPLYRILYVGGLSILLSLICHLKVAGVYIAGFSTDALGTSVPCAFLFGVACGWSENMLASAVTPHITRILTGLQQTRVEPSKTSSSQE